MNVLVYAGSEVNPKSLESTLGSLRSVCLPNYTVQLLTKASFTKEPWEIACALFVLPSLNSSATNADVQIFNPKEVQRIRDYVEQGGGAFLGLGLGARLEESRSLESVMGKLNLGLEGGAYIKEEDRREPLKFHDTVSKSYVYPVSGPATKPELVTGKDQATIDVQVADATFPADGKPKNLDVLATTASRTVAGHISVGKGHVALATLALDSDNDSVYPLLRSILSSLNFQLPSPDVASASLSDLSPLPQFITSIPSISDARPKPIVSLLLRPFFAHASASSFLAGSIKDTADTFKFVSISAEWTKDIVEGKQTSLGSENKDDKHVIVCPDGGLPPKEYTPRFDHKLYYETLRGLKGLDSSPDPQGWGFGEALLYSERVTSTQSMFDKNPTLLSGLPAPVLSIAAQQLAGRGRGKNVWLSPEGCLMMSLLLRVNLDPGGRGNATGSAKTGKTTAKTSANDQSSGAKTSKTSEVQPAKTTKTESSGAKTSSSETKTSASGVADDVGTANLKTAPSGSGDSLKTAETKTAKTTSSGGEQLKTSAAGPEASTKTAKTTSSSGDQLKTHSTGPEASTKTAKTTSSGEDQLKTNVTSPGSSAKTTKTTKTEIAGEKPETKTIGSATKGTKTSQTKTTSSDDRPTLKSSLIPNSIYNRLASAFEPPVQTFHPNPIPLLSASKLVFIQYLFALAVCEACRLPEVLGPELGKRVRIKWPNDLYLDLSERGVGGRGEPNKNLKKIGGILVNTNFAPGGKVDIVIGCGLNVLNAPPISSLVQLLSEQSDGFGAPLSLERTAAAIMSTFERLWDKFTESDGSFEPFLSDYYDVWLHTDQRVTVTTTSPPTNARIVGITPDYGLLRTVRDDGVSSGWEGTYGRYVYSASEGGKEYIDLQPDGNSFDLMANLIKAKTT